MPFCHTCGSSLPFPPRATISYTPHGDRRTYTYSFCDDCATKLIERPRNGPPLFNVPPSRDPSQATPDPRR